MKKLRARLRSMQFDIICGTFTLGMVAMIVAIPVMGRMGRGRPYSDAASCKGNLKQIQSAKDQWVSDTHALPTSSPRELDLFGESAYIRATPTCPNGGRYSLGAVHADPTCSVGRHGTPADPDDDHILPQ